MYYCVIKVAVKNVFKGKHVAYVFPYIIVSCLRSLLNEIVTVGFINCFRIKYCKLLTPGSALSYNLVLFRIGKENRFLRKCCI